MSTGQGLLGNNMFAYCRNNAVSRIDITGTADAAHYRDDGRIFSSDDLGKHGGGGSSGMWDAFWQSMQDATKGLSMAVGGRNALSSERHHILSDKHKTYTPQYKEIADQYNMSLNSIENIVILQGHHGRHTNVYHNFMLGTIISLDIIANRNPEIFREGFAVIAAFLKENPGLPYAR